MIDLRSDTVTRPTPAMREAMAQAEVGDDVFGDDPSVLALQHHAAALLGKEAALFTPSATQANLIALLTHCARGDEYLVGQEAHNYLYEAGGGAVLGGIQPQPLSQEPDGTLNLDRLAQLIKPDDYHFAKTRLLCLENTTYGKILPRPYLERAATFAQEHHLRTHLDGARIFNAAVACHTPARDLAAPFDSVTICLSKGLGAPVGALLLGEAAFLKQASRWRKMLGGGMRQSGILAAAGLYALEHHIPRLAQDHRNAELLAHALRDLPQLEVEPPQTNMLFLKTAPEFQTPLLETLRKHQILTTSFSHNTLRLVTHLDVDQEHIATAAAAFRAAFT